MSWKRELTELIDWLAEMTADKPNTPDPQSLPREDWQLVRDALERAAKAFREAGDLIPRPGKISPLPVTADLAYDLSFETKALADRAYLLGRRARPKVDKSADELAKELASKSASNERLAARVKKLEAEVDRLDTGAPTRDRKPGDLPEAKVKTPSTPTAAERIHAGQGSVATARDKLFSVTPAEQAVVNFAEELEVLNDLIAGWHRVNRRSA